MTFENCAFVTRWFAVVVATDQISSVADTDGPRPDAGETTIPIRRFYGMTRGRNMLTAGGDVLAGGVGDVHESVHLQRSRRC